MEGSAQKAYGRQGSEAPVKSRMHGQVPAQPVIEAFRGANIGAMGDNRATLRAGQILNTSQNNDISSEYIRPQQPKYLQGPPGRHVKSFGYYNQKGAPQLKELFEEKEDSRPGKDPRGAQQRLIEQTPVSVSSFIKEQAI